MKPVIITRAKLVDLQVCAEEGVADEAIEGVANAEYPTGIESHWQINHDESHMAPVTCGRYPTRRHVMLLC